MGEDRTLMATIWKRQMRWMGHIMRGELRVAIEGRGKENPERKKKKDNAGRYLGGREVLRQKEYHKK